MANIATVAVAAFIKPETPRGQVTPHGLLRVMTRYHGRTYCVPTWSYDDYPQQCIYTQHGEKWSPTGVYDVWGQYGTFLDAVWVRWYDDGGDHDVIFCLEAERGASSWCRYAFDSIRVFGREDAESLSLGSGWNESRPGVWESTLSGSYLAGNDRCDLLADRYTTHRSCTTPVSARIFARDGFCWVAGDLPSDVTQWAPTFATKASRVELLWRGRPTQVYHHHNERWWSWNLDDWDNCVNAEWLTACTNRNERRSARTRPSC